MSNGNAKGSSFERKMATRLSNWWTHGERDDVFWRTQQSGGRATMRAKSDKTTFGQEGDLQATDPIGAPLTDAFCIELKIGYGSWSFLDALDGLKATGKSTYEKFRFQADHQAFKAGKAPLLICQRDRKVPILVMPREIFNAIYDFHGRFIKTNFQIYIPEAKVPHNAIRLYDFFDWCAPETMATIGSHMVNGKLKRD
jgi:hypothetical protein